MDCVEFEIANVIRKAKKFFERKHSHYSNFPSLHSAGVPQQMHTYPNIGSSSANGPGSPQFNPPLLSISRIEITYCNTQVKNTYSLGYLLGYLLGYQCVVFPFFILLHMIHTLLVYMFQSHI